MTAANILQSALGHMQDRAATYDKPDGERSMGATVDAFKAVTGVLMTEEQGWLFMALLKAVRSQQGAYRADSYEDGAAYFALAGESAAKERNGGWDAEAIKAAALPASFGQQNMMAGDRVTISGLREWIDPADVEICEDKCAGCFAGCRECCPRFAKLSDEKMARMREESDARFVEALCGIPVEPASEIDDESPRADAIGQNGNTGEHYSFCGEPPIFGNCELESVFSVGGRERAQADEDGSFWSERGRRFNMGRWQVRQYDKPVQQNGEMAAEVYAAVDAVNPWKGAPDWAKHAVMHSDGKWCYYEYKPLRISADIISR